MICIHRAFRNTFVLFAIHSEDVIRYRCFSDSVGALPFPLKGALMPATWSKAYLREGHCVMSRAPPLGTDGALMHRRRLWCMTTIWHIFAKSVYMRIEAYLQGNIVFSWALGPVR